MIVFAWILWSYTLLNLIIAVIGVIKNNIQDRRYRVELGNLIITVATFVFMTIYIFAR